MSKTRNNPTRNAKLSARAREKVMELYPTHSYPQIKAILEDGGFLPPGETIHVMTICRLVLALKKEREEAMAAHKAEVNRTIVDQVLPALVGDLTAMGDLADRIVLVGDELYTLAHEEMTLFCETGPPETLPDGRVVRPIIRGEDGRPVLRMPRDLKIEIEARGLRVKALLASVGCYRLAGMVRLTAIQTAGLAPADESMPVVVLPEIVEVPDVPD